MEHTEPFLKLIANNGTPHDAVWMKSCGGWCWRGNEYIHRVRLDERGFVVERAKDNGVISHDLKWERSNYWWKVLVYSSHGAIVVSVMNTNNVGEPE